LAIAVDNLADAESLTEMENEKKKERAEEEKKELESSRSSLNESQNKRYVWA